MDFLRTCRALLAVCLLAAGAHAEDAAADVKPTGVYLPTTPNDYSGMIYSLLQEQTNRVMNKEGATVSLISFSHNVLVCLALFWCSLTSVSTSPEPVAAPLGSSCALACRTRATP